MTRLNRHYETYVQSRWKGKDIAWLLELQRITCGWALEVVADSCNSIELTWCEWEEAATANGADFLNIEVICSDADEHRRRVESRRSDVAGLKLPAWNDVQNREY